MTIRKNGEYGSHSFHEESVSHGKGAWPSPAFSSSDVTLGANPRKMSLVVAIMNKTEDRGMGVVGASVGAMRGCGEKGPAALASAVSCEGRVLSILVM